MFFRKRRARSEEVSVRSGARGGAQREGLSDRRDLLRAGGMSAVGAAAAMAAGVVRAAPASAANGDGLVLGSTSNAETTGTLLTFDGPAFTANSYALAVTGGNADASLFADRPAIVGIADADRLMTGVEGIGMRSTTGVTGRSESGDGVYGVGPQTGVRGLTGDGIGLAGEATDNGTGVGAASDGTGTALIAGAYGSGGAVEAFTSVLATKAAILATSGNKIRPAVNATGCIVLPNGTSVRAQGQGQALKVVGVATFSRSGVAHISATSTTIDVPGGVSSASRVLATMQTATSANVTVKHATPAPSTGTVTITLTDSAPPGGVDVAWFVIG